MADFVVIGPGMSAASIAAEAVGGIYVQAVKVIPGTVGGYSFRHLVAAASTNQTNIKAAVGQLYGVRIFNAAAYPIYVKFHNTETVPTAGVGVAYTIGVQGGTHRDVIIVAGIAFSAGIGLTIVRGLSDADATAVAANDCVVDVEFA